jgi:lipoyl(octanoyl) transferase
MTPDHPVRAVWIGRRPYEPIHELMKTLHRARMEGRGQDILLLCEHDPVITLGRGAKADNVLFPREMLAARGVELVETGRGGDVTYHGPGQLVAYPIVDLRPDRCDVRKYVRSLCETMVLMARDHGVESGEVDGLVGVWADRTAPTEWAGAPWARDLVKIGAVGVRLSRWVTMHGFALNVNVALDAYSLIVPCGISDFGVASIRDLTGSAPTVRDLALAGAAYFRRAFDAAFTEVTDLSAEPALEARLLDRPSLAAASAAP